MQNHPRAPRERCWLGDFPPSFRLGWTPNRVRSVAQFSVLMPGLGKLHPSAFIGRAGSVRVEGERSDRQNASFRAVLVAWVGILGLFCASDALVPNASAQEADERGVLIFKPEYFANFQPVTALDIVGRVPGFALDEGSSVRGFGGAAGNVLIDGERPSTKSEGLSDILLRIPAGSVDHIELIRGGVSGYDLQGQAIVVNVVRSNKKRFDVTASVSGRVFDDGRVAGGGDIAGTFRATPNTIWDGKISLFRQLESFNAFETRQRPIGRLEQTSVETTFDPYRDINGNIGIEHKFPDKSVLHARITAESEHFGSAFFSTLLDGQSIPVGNEIAPFDFFSRNYEGSVDYERKLSKTLSAKIVALQSTTRSSNISGFTAFSNGAFDNASRFIDNSLSGESVLRLNFTWKPHEKLTIETGGEGAYNFRDSATQFALDNDGTGLVPIPLPNSNVRVEESRGETYFTATLVQSKKLTLEGGFRAEFSNISQGGETALSRFFFFPKPSAQVTYSPGKGRQWRFSTSRDVGQLDFGDFVSSADLTDAQVNAGNANLAPTAAWVFDGNFEQRWKEKNSINLSFEYRLVNDVTDLIPIDNRFDAVGNIGTGRRFQARINTFLLLDFIGLHGATFEGTGRFRFSRVRDPVTDEFRRVSFEEFFQLETELRQDLRKLKSTFGGTVFWNTPSRFYRIDQIVRRVQTPYVEVFWDYKKIKNTSIRFVVTNLVDTSNPRERLFFDGTRASQIPVRLDRRESRSGPFGIVRIRRTF